MIPVLQRISAFGGASIPGDCVKCCVASVLELSYEDVPHFVAGEWLIAPRATNGMAAGPPERVDWLTALNDWLRETGWALRAMQTMYYKHPLPPGAAPLDWYEPRSAPRGTAPRGTWIAVVISENYEQSTHAVVMHDDAVAHDPSMRPRRTPYQFVGEIVFVTVDPAACRARTS